MKPQRPNRTGEKIFTEIYKENKWRSEESRSGSGSALDQTEAVRHWLPKIFSMLEVESVLDIPCGDFHWWKEMGIDPAIVYMGADIVPELVEANNRLYGDYFQVLDIVSDKLPKVDILLVRDCLGHLSNQNVRTALSNLRASGSKYLLATHFPDSKWRVDADIYDGGWRPINLDVQFGLGLPILSLSEQLAAPADGAYRDKTLSLWRLN